MRTLSLTLVLGSVLPAQRLQVDPQTHRPIDIQVVSSMPLIQTSKTVKPPVKGPNWVATPAGRG